LHVLDMQQNPGDMKTIEGEIEALAQTKGVPDIVYIDWAGFLAAQLMAKSADKNATKTSFIKQIGDASTILAQRYNNFILVGHQLHPEKAQRGPFSQMTPYDGEECRGFTASMKYVFVLGPRCAKTSLQIMSLVKARDDKPDQRVIIRVDGARARIEQAPGWKVKQNRFVQEGRDEKAIPNGT